MNVLDRTLPWQPRIDLAREPDFSVGKLHVRPSRREVEASGHRLVLQRRVMQVLVALAHPSSEVVSQDELISRCWGGLAVGEDAVGRCIGQLRRVAASWPEPPFQIETIAGVGYRLVIAAGPTASTTSALPRPPSWRNRWIAAATAALAAILCVAGLLALHPWTPARATAAAPAIAVLSFQALGGGPGGKALAAALPRRVADALTQYPVTVIGPSAGAPAGADFVVEGRVADKDGRLHVVADLSDAHDHVLVYSFDTVLPADPKGDVAGEIANHVALSLDPTKFSNDLGGKLTAADYALIARANDGIDRWDPPDFLDQTQRLAARHPEDGELKASVAIAAIYAAQVEPAGQRPQLLQLGRKSIAEAERISPGSGLLYVAKELLANGPMSYPEEERLLRRSLSLNPGLHVTYNGLGGLLLSVGRVDEGATLLKRSVQLDPMSGLVVADAIHELAMVGRTVEASDILAREEQVWPGRPQTVDSRFALAMYQGDARQILALDGARPPARGSLPAVMAQAAAGQGPGSDRALSDYCSSLGRNRVRDTLDAACLVETVRLGHLDEAFRLAALAYPDLRGAYPIDSDAWIIQAPPWLDPDWLFSPVMKPFRDDPRFWDVAVRTGLVNYWQTTGSWPDFCQPQLDSCKRLAAAAAQAHPAPPMGRG